ncbi:MAG: hypothetical protein OHK0029_03660 [Armatimonadaceae bacterium]
MLFHYHAIVREGEIGLLYRNGQYVQTVPPGRHRLRAFPWDRETLTTVDVRRQQINLAGQEMLTADGLSVRLNVVAEYRVVDAPRAVHTVMHYDSTLYTLLQVLLREAVQARTLETLLADRGAVATELRERGATAAEELGLSLLLFSLKDIILPGDVKKLMAQEAAAIREARAALAAAREEVATVRARANTARTLSENPTLLRLRELEALIQVAEGKGNTVVLALPPETLAAVSAVTSATGKNT